ncbi:MAG TPA: hemolysin III family protein, partial [Opitutaceae bacterium]|nr:hemolysin III family protein [Opitutaceae bacterium]
ARFYRQHTKHHALTRIARKTTRDGRGIIFIENKYPILDSEQHEASFFPWYTLLAFGCILVPLYSLLQWLLPSFPWFFSGFGALASSLALYELVHAIEHWSLDRWEPLIRHRHWGAFWRAAYSFHLRHHAVIDCNESISGFFCLPLADLAFGTLLMPRSIYADGAEWTPDEFRSPRPIWPVRILDEAAERVVQRHREEARAGTQAIARDQGTSPGERIAAWVTNGLGVALGILALAVLTVSAGLYGNAWHIVSFSVFGLTLLLLYSVYTLYHAWRTERGRQVLLKLARASVFLLIAGTYTPFLLVSLRGPWGWSLFGAVWGLCGAGAVIQFFIGNRYRVTSTLATLFVGWMVVVAIKPLFAAVPHGGFWLLLAGGLCYTAGTFLAALRRLRYHQAFRSAFVLCGSTCHFLAVLLFVLPQHV